MKQPKETPQVEDEDGYKLWYFCFETEVPLYVMAKTHEEATQIAKDNVDEEARDLLDLWGDNFTRWPVKTRKMISKAWLEGNPYDERAGKSTFNDRTVGEIMLDWEEREAARLALEPLPNQEALPFGGEDEGA